MLHHLDHVRFQRSLREQPRGGVLRLDDLPSMAAAAGVSLLQASLLLDADPCWQRLLVDEDGYPMAAPGARDDGTASGSCEVVWRRLRGNRRSLAA